MSGNFTMTLDDIMNFDDNKFNNLNAQPVKQVKPKKDNMNDAKKQVNDFIKDLKKSDIIDIGFKSKSDLKKFIKDMDLYRKFSKFDDVVEFIDYVQFKHSENDVQEVKPNQTYSGQFLFFKEIDDALVEAYQKKGRNVIQYNKKHYLQTNSQYISVDDSNIYAFSRKYVSYKDRKKWSELAYILRKELRNMIEFNDKTKKYQFKNSYVQL